MSNLNSKNDARNRRKKHIRKTVLGTTERPRLCVFRSTRHIYAQIIDDRSGKTLCAASSMALADGDGGNVEGARQVGQKIAEAAVAAKIETVVFDRNGYLYHGRVAALADAARTGGLQF